MRFSNGSSDVCPSDLVENALAGLRLQQVEQRAAELGDEAGVAVVALRIPMLGRLRGAGAFAAVAHCGAPGSISKPPPPSSFFLLLSEAASAALKMKRPSRSTTFTEPWA